MTSFFRKEAKELVCLGTVFCRVHKVRRGGYTFETSLPEQVPAESYCVYICSLSELWRRRNSVWSTCLAFSFLGFKCSSSVLSTPNQGWGLLLSVLLRLIHVTLMGWLRVRQASDWHLFFERESWYKVRLVTCTANLKRYSAVQKAASISMGISGQCHGEGVDSASLSWGYTLYRPCAGLWVAPGLSPGCAKPTAVPLSAASAVSDSIGCESATRFTEGREQCILQSCLSLITLWFFSTPDVFIFAPFVKYLGNCLQLPSYVAFNSEICGSFSLPLEKLFLQPLNISSAICWKALRGWQTPFNASIPLSCQPFSWRALFHMSILFLSGRVSALLFNIKPWDFPVWRG